MNDKKLILGNYFYILEELTLLQNLVFLLVFENLAENKHEALDKVLRNSC